MDGDTCYSSDEEYFENEEEMLDIQCLFCDCRMAKFDAIFEHFKAEHNVTFVEDCRHNKVDLYGFYKIVNYIRGQGVKAEDFSKVLTSKVWDEDRFLVPVSQDDEFFMFDYDEDADELEPSMSEQDNPHSRLNDVLELKDVQAVKEHYQDASMERILDDLFKLKLQYEETKRCLTLVTDVMGDDGPVVKASPTQVENLNENTDSNYIDSYAHFDIHHQMLSDAPRTIAYRDAILKNADFFRGKTVLDIGCGTGILSMFAARAGASIVVGVDQSGIVVRAKEIVALNKLDAVVKIVSGKLENIDFEGQNLPAKFDIIISEWMGYFLLFEGMLDTVLYARDRILAPGGRLLPNKSTMFLAAFDAEEKYRKSINFWDDVYGFDMTPMKRDVVKEASIDTLPADRICSSSALIADIDIDSCSLDTVQTFDSKFELTIERDSTVHGIIGWFDCDFSSMPSTVVLSTSPAAETTHWSQTLFYFQKPLTLSAGSRLSGSINVRRASHNIRALIVDITVPEHELHSEYLLN